MYPCRELTTSGPLVEPRLAPNFQSALLRAFMMIYNEQNSNLSDGHLTEIYSSR